MPRETKYFTKGMNTDVEDRLLSRDQYRYALNCDFDLRDGKGGVITNEKGATLVSVTLPTGDNTVIGKREWVGQDAVIYLMYNSLSNHSIWKYSITTNTLTKILENSILGFSLDRRIHSINIFDDNLLWCDDLAPKHIVISSALAHTNGTAATKDIFPYDGLLTTGTDEQKLEFITAGTNPPLLSPGVSYLHDPESANFIWGKMYIYFDGSRSSFSPVSKVGLPILDENLTRTKLPRKNNSIVVGYHTGGPNVKRIEIAIRENGTSSWVAIGIVDKFSPENVRIFADDIIQDFKWVGEKGYALPDSELLNYYQVPITAKTQTLSHNNMLFYGALKQGHDPVATTVTPTLTQTQYLEANLIEGAVVDLPLTTNSTKVNEVSLVQAFTDLNSGDKLHFTITGGATANVTYVVPSPKQSLDTTFYTDISNFIENYGYTTIVNAPNPGDLTFTSVNEFGRVWFDNEFIKVYQNWKSGVKHIFGMVYFDEKGRHGGVNKIPDVEIPYIGLLPFSITPSAFYNEITLSISHLAPSWAKTYQIVYGGSDVSYFLQGFTTGVDLNVTYNEKKTFKFTGNSNYSAAIANQGIEYEFIEGDRLRVYGEFFVISAVSEVNNLLDVKILGLDAATGDIFTEEAIDTFIVSNNKYIYEIYRPKNIVDDIYYEIGEVRLVEDGFHKGDGGNDQTTVNPAGIIIRSGDSYITPLELDAGQDMIAIEAVNYSKHYPSSVTDKGRLHVYNETIQQKDLTNHFIYGGRYFEDVQTNRLFEFSANNDQSVSSEDGEIRRLISVGYTIKIIQDKKISSAYLNRQIAVNPGGTDGIIISDKVVGEIRPYPQDFGSQHPESVFLNNRYLYMWDARNGVAIRDDANGPDSISKFDFNTGSKRLSETYYQGRIFGGYDETRGCLLWTFGDETKNETVRYDYNGQVWRGFYEYYPENYLSLSMLFISFKNGSIWIHNNDTIKGNLYGTQNRMVMKTVFNENPTNTKTFLATAIHSNKKWSAPNQGDVKTEDTDMYGTQETRILENKFKYQDRVFYSDIPRDMKTPNVIAPVINGDKMQGSILEIQIENNHSQEVKLFAIDVNYLNNTEI